MLYHILRQCSPAELENMDDQAIPEELKQQLETKPESELGDKAAKMKRKLVLKNKIQSIGRMNLMLSNMRKNQEILLEMKQMSPDGKLPKGALLEARPTIEFATQQFTIVKNLDA